VKNKLQDAAQRTMINADKTPREIFSKAQVSTFEMMRLIDQNLK